MRKTISIYFDDMNFLRRVRERAAEQGRSVSRHVRWLIEEDCNLPHPQAKPRQVNEPAEE